MRIKNAYLLISIILILATGLFGAYYFGTLNTLSRELKDFFCMLALVVSLLISGVLIVILLLKTDHNDPPIL